MQHCSEADLLASFCPQTKSRPLGVASKASPSASASLSNPEFTPASQALNGATAVCLALLRRLLLALSPGKFCVSRFLCLCEHAFQEPGNSTGFVLSKAEAPAATDTPVFKSPEVATSQFLA